MLLLHWVILFASISQQSGFSNPNFVTPYGSGLYDNVVVWYIGQTERIVYDLSGTELDDYTVALWQQDINGGGASEGPVVNRTTPPESRDSFSWTVQLYDFDLDNSNVFFFWIFNGSADNQGNTAYKDVSSAYFNISNEDPSANSITTSSASSLATTSTTGNLLSSHTITADTSLSVATVSTTSKTKEQNSNEPSATGASKSDSESTNSTSGGLSTAAGVGIGVGIAVAGICAVVCAIILVRFRRKRILLNDVDVPEGTAELEDLSYTGTRHQKKIAMSADTTHQAGDSTRKLHNSYVSPVELDIGETIPVELDATSLRYK